MQRRSLNITLAALLAILILYGIFTPYRLILVSGSSMEPTFHHGQLLIGRKESRCRRPLVRGDVVLARHGRESILKRVHALPGDEVVIFHLEEGCNLLVQADDYVRYFRLVEELGAARIERYEVPEGNCFLLGDAPLVSLDSRDFGCVPFSALRARIP